MTGDPVDDQQTESGSRRKRRGRLGRGWRLRGDRGQRIGWACLWPPTLGELEHLLTVGGARTTPPPEDWPRRFRPRLGLWAIGLSGAVYLVLSFLVGALQLRFLLPLLAGVGGVLLPLATLLVFFEANRRRDISWVALLLPLGLGAAAALLMAFPAWVAGPALGLPSALAVALGALVHEAVKLGVLLVVLGGLRYRGTLAGLLFGAAVGAGFVMGQTLGGVLALDEPTAAAVRAVVGSGGAAAPLGYQMVWSALVGGALWRGRGGQGWDRSLLLAPAVLRAVGWAAGLHLLWVLPLGLPGQSQALILGVVGWVALASYLGAGWRESLGPQRVVA